MRCSVWFDGSYNWQTRRASGGALLHFGLGKPDKKFHWDLGETSMNGCEFLALLNAVKEALLLGVREFEIFGDSKLVIQVMKKSWKAKAPHIRAWRDEILKLLRGLKYDFNWIRREHNRIADELSKPGAVVEQQPAERLETTLDWLESASEFIS